MKRVLPRNTKFYSVILDFCTASPRFYLIWIPSGIIEVDWALMGVIKVWFTGFIGFDCLTGFGWVLLGFIRFYWVLLGFTGFYWIFLGFTAFYRVSLSFIGFSWVLLGFPGFYWLRRG